MTEKENRCNLVAWCMKTTFERKVAEKIAAGISMTELDNWLDPIIRNYFRELDAVHRFYHPEFADDYIEYVETDDHIRREKRGVINYCLQLALGDNAIDILNSSKSLEAADEKLIVLLKEVKGYGDRINEFYGFEDEEESEE